MSEDLERLPAHDIAAEQAVLGAAMLSPDACATVLEKITSPDQFFRAAHGLVYRAVRALADRGEAVDAITVAGELRAQGNLQPAGGGPYLAELIESVPVVTNVAHHARIVRATATLRDLAAAGITITQLGRGTTDLDEVDTVIEQARSVLDHATGAATPPTMRPVAELIIPLIDTIASGPDDAARVDVPWIDLRHLLGGGLRPGQLVTVGGRPGVGKSVVLVNLAAHVGVTLGRPVLLVTLEMSGDEVMLRLVSADSKVSLYSLNLRDISETQWEAIGRSRARLADATQLYIDDTPGAGIAHIRARLHSMRRAGHPAELVIIDYLQLMTTGKRVESRQVEVSQLSRGLKLLAKEFGVPVVVGSQLNRAVEQRNDKKPQLADLRESGSVEQDSDVVILIDRPDAYEKESPRAGETDLIVAKNRNGPTATVTVASQLHYARMVDLAPEPHIPAPTPHRGHLAAVPD